MNWGASWVGRWLGEWAGSLGADDGSIYGASAQALADVVGASSGAMFAVGDSTRELDAITGPASATLAIVGASTATLGDVASTEAAIAPPKPFVGVGGGWLVGRRPLPAIAGRSAVELDDVTGEATGKVTAALTPRQRKGRRDDMDLMVSGWR